MVHRLCGERIQDVHVAPLFCFIRLFVRCFSGLQDVKFGLPLTDVAKLTNALILEYTMFPVSREDAVGLPAEDLADQLRCAKAQEAVKNLQCYLKKETTSLLDAVNQAFCEDSANEFLDSVSARLTDDPHTADATLKDGIDVVKRLITSLASFAVPGKSEVGLV